jgi:hypothetical protein
MRVSKTSILRLKPKHKPLHSAHSEVPIRKAKLEQAEAEVPQTQAVPAVIRKKLKVKFSPDLNQVLRNLKPEFDRRAIVSRHAITRSQDTLVPSKGLLKCATSRSPISFKKLKARSQLHSLGRGTLD